jgi:murein peptide amidase A
MRLVYPLVILLLLLCGCVSPSTNGRYTPAPDSGPVVVEPPEPAIEPLPEPPPPRPVHDVVFTVGRSMRGEPLRCRIMGTGKDVVFFLATIHGNESAGTPLLDRLAAHLRSHPEMLEGRKIILLRDANPDGHLSNTRSNARGVDLNRNFPSANFRDRATGGTRPLSEPESRALHDLIREHRPARVISIHQPLSLIDHDGPGEALARAMARTCDLPVKKLGGRHGSMGSWVGIDLGIPIITVELPRSADRLSVDERWRRYGPMLLVAITHRR